MRMRQIMAMLAAAACLTLIGCGQSPSEKLIGKWQCNPLDQGDPSEEPAEQVGLVEGLWAGTVEKLGQATALEIEFHEDQTVTGGWLLFNEPGTIYWSVGETDGDRVTLQFSRQDGESTMEVKITFVDNDHFRLAPSDAVDKTLLFERVAPE